MDIPRKSAARNRRIKRILYIVIGVMAIGGITLAVSRLKPAAPTVDRATVWDDTVKRGDMLRQVRGLGTLVPEEIRWIPAVTQGRVERIIVKPGAEVTPNTVLLELSNPELEQSLQEAEQQYKAAKANYKSLEVTLEKRLLDQQATTASAKANYSEAKLNAEVNDELSEKGLIAPLQHKVSKVRAEDLKTRYEIEQKRLEITADEAKAQLAAQQATLEQSRTLYELRRSQMEALNVRPGMTGVLQQVEVQEGQQVTPGLNLARVANPQQLKAELRIAETQAKDVQIGQKASIDTRNGIIPGRVIRKDPGAVNGTVTVDVSLEGDLPKGAVPSLNVDGTIELERLVDILYVGRPVQGQENAKIMLFKFEEDGQHASKVTIQLGRSSVSVIEVVEGLKEGDRVILSDMSAWDNVNRIRLN
ncbi:MAG: efflux RND transporter periplasmic adaptor subunit [Blastocatellia bacterium]|nr:efflux RND transporter periplasmic adaptor subunit [Blastocatellia bacterium]